MRATLLTDLSIKNLEVRDNQYEVFDRKAPGLTVRVSPGGTKAFVLIYRIGGRSRRYTLGRHPILSLKDARQLSLAASKEIATGSDPQARKLDDRLTYNACLFPSVVESYIENYAKRKTVAWKETERIMNREFVGRWKNYRLKDITKQNVNRVIDELVANNGPSAANHAFAVLRKFFNWCVERGELNQSPCAGLKSPSKNVARDRVLTEAELTEVWRSTEAMGYPFGPFVRLLLLTGQRKSEVAKLRWEYLDLEKQLWTQPSSTNKSKRVHLVPLNDDAVAILKRLPRLHPEIVFPARGNDQNSISGFSKWMSKLSRVSHTKDWTLHDIRRTVTTGMAIIKVDPHVADLILNHRSTVIGGVAAVYNRHDY